MIPMEDLQAEAAFEDLSAGPATVTHVDIRYNAGHPGVEQPHYHIVLWHVPQEEAAALEQAQ